MHIQIVGAELAHENAFNNHTTFDLTLDQEVTVTESFYPDFSPLSFITMMGGALGLWLGLGAVQLMEYAIGVVTWTFHYVTFTKMNK